MRPRSSIRHALVLSALLGGLPQAWAAAPDRCQEDRACQEQTARAAQLASQTSYEEALTLYQSAYDRIQEPRLLLNIGRCHYRLGRARRALETYETFQKAEPDPEPEVAARLAQFVAEAKLAIASDLKGHHPTETPGTPGNKDAPSNPTPGGVPLVVPPSAPGEEPPPTESGSVAKGRTVAGRPLYRVAIGASMLGVGATLLGVGIGALAGHGQCVNPSDANPDQCAVFAQPDGTFYTSVRDGVTPGVPLLVIGVGLAAGGIALIALPPRKPASSSGSHR